MAESFSAPFLGYLSDQYSMQTARRMVFTSSIFAAISLIASGFMVNIYGVIILFGLIPGEGIEDRSSRSLKLHIDVI